MDVYSCFNYNENVHFNKKNISIKRNLFNKINQRTVNTQKQIPKNFLPVSCLLIVFLFLSLFISPCLILFLILLCQNWKAEVGGVCDHTFAEWFLLLPAWVSQAPSLLTLELTHPSPAFHAWSVPAFFFHLTVTVSRSYFSTVQICLLFWM